MWQQVQFNGPPPGQRFCHVAAVYDSSLIIFGGYDGTSRLNDFKQYRFGEDTFELEIPESTLIPDLRHLVNTDVMSDITFLGTILLRFLYPEPAPLEPRKTHGIACVLLN